MDYLPDQITWLAVYTVLRSGERPGIRFPWARGVSAGENVGTV